MGNLASQIELELLVLFHLLFYTYSDVICNGGNPVGSGWKSYSSGKFFLQYQIHLLISDIFRSTLTFLYRHQIRKRKTAFRDCVPNQRVWLILSTRLINSLGKFVVLLVRELLLCRFLWICVLFLHGIHKCFFNFSWDNKAIILILIYVF